MKTGRNTDIVGLRLTSESVALSGSNPHSNAMRKAGEQEQPKEAMVYSRPYRNLRFLRLLLFQDQAGAMRPLSALLQTHLEQKETKATKSVIVA
jgi:hypothetical protein